MIFIIEFSYEIIVLRKKMNLFLYSLIISNAAKKIEYNHGLAITLRLVFKILVGIFLANQRILWNLCKVITDRWENSKKWCGKKLEIIGGMVKFLIMRKIQSFMNSLTVQGCSNTIFESKLLSSVLILASQRKPSKWSIWTNRIRYQFRCYFHDRYIQHFYISTQGW